MQAAVISPGRRWPPREDSPNISTDSPTPESADRKSTRLNSSHLVISYAVFCLKKKKTSSPSPHSLAGSDLRPILSTTSRVPYPHVPCDAPCHCTCFMHLCNCHVLCYASYVAS